jgi:hypothetical protein
LRPGGHAGRHIHRQDAKDAKKAPSRLALGRFDGENYNIGFLDVCNRPYEALGLAARASHERLYKVASGAEKPYSDAPKYLPKLFM